MTLLLTMLPIYLLGNLHCVGMCGPLVMLIGRHPMRGMYFLGRLFSFSTAGFLSGALGSVLKGQLASIHLSCLVSLVFGAAILIFGSMQLFSRTIPLPRFAQRISERIEQAIALLVGQGGALPIFLFGVFTLLLPCGQTLVVFTACALSGSAMAGLVNGLAFALLTSPSLFFAMAMRRRLGAMRLHYQTVMGVLALLVGSLAVCRGLADAQLMPHCVLNPGSRPAFHIVLF